jgi:luciferase family oxidoreductase group 1
MIDLPPLSLLEVAAIESGTTAAEAALNAVEVARRAEELGFHRIWFTEHHSSPTMVDFPPAIVSAHVAARTSSIRVGSGGVLAPNHAPLSLAEQFSALGAYHPGRIDLGIGRGPGTLDEEVARALRWGSPPATDEEYAGRVAAILRLVDERKDDVEPWLLSSSPGGAALAAALGLPLAVAYHLRPDNAAAAVDRYQNEFRPSRWADSPRVLLSIQTVCADTEEEAAFLNRPGDIALLTLLNGEGSKPLLSPEVAAERVFTSQELERLERSTATVQGNPEQVGRQLADIARRFAADELMLLPLIYDVSRRTRSLALMARMATGSALQPTALTKR